MFEQRKGADSGFVVGQKLVYRELGWEAEVEVLANSSNEHQERYTLQMIRILRRGLSNGPQNRTFEVSALRNFYVGWTLLQD